MLRPLSRLSVRTLTSALRRPGKTRPPSRSGRHRLDTLEGRELPGSVLVGSAGPVALVAADVGANVLTKLAATTTWTPSSTAPVAVPLPKMLAA